MVDKKEEKIKSVLQDTLDDFLGDIDEEKLKLSAGLDIKPKLYIEDVGVENAKQVEVLSAGYKIEIPKEKSMSKTDDHTLKIIDVKYENVEHQFIAQAISFRYQYGVIMEQLGFKKTETFKMVGAIIKIWQEWVELEKFGKQKLYKVALISKPPK